MYIYVYIYIDSSSFAFESLSAQLISNEDLGEPEDESAQTRALGIGCCL